MSILTKLLNFVEYAGVAAAGSLVMYSMSNEGKTTKRGYVMAGVSGAFVGYLVGAICEHYGLQGRIVGAIAGIAGSFGAENVLRVLHRALLSKIGATQQKVEENADGK